jgi:hypothetical protein
MLSMRLVDSVYSAIYDMKASVWRAERIEALALLGLFAERRDPTVVEALLSN